MTRENSYSMVGPNSKQGLMLVSDWYFKEWSISHEKVTQLFSHLKVDGSLPLQIAMFLDEEPVATGGVYNQVDLLGLGPEYTLNAPWFMMIYVKDEYRMDSIGAIFSTLVLERAFVSGILKQESITVFTHEDDTGYEKLGWRKVTPFVSKEKIVFCYKKTL